MELYVATDSRLVRRSAEAWPRGWGVAEGLGRGRGAGRGHGRVQGPGLPEAAD